MSIEFVELLREIRQNIDRSEGEIKARFVAIETGVNDLFKRLGRPGQDDVADTDPMTEAERDELATFARAGPINGCPEGERRRLLVKLCF
jgi:hypothetical protein